MAAGAVFAVTCIWDVILRDFAEGSLRIAGIHRWGWVRDLRPYFASHSIVGAACIAGAVGVLALSIIRLHTPAHTAIYIAWVFTVSMLIGVPMRVPGWFDELQLHYYDKHPYLAYLTDGMSGIVVWATVVALRQLASTFASTC